MSNEYNDWLSEQTFETLASDNLRIKTQLLQLKAENERLRGLLGKPYKRRLDLENKSLTQKLEKARELCKEDWEDMTVYKFQQQLLKELE